jgi:hypothetical protein
LKSKQSLLNLSINRRRGLDWIVSYGSSTVFQAALKTEKEAKKGELRDVPATMSRVKVGGG